MSARPSRMNLLIGIGLIALNVVGVGLSLHRRQARASLQQNLLSNQTEQARQLAAWHEAKTLPIRSSGACTEAIKTLGPAPEIDCPLGMTERHADELPSEQWEDLVHAVHGLMRAYERDRASDLVQYMKSRGELLSEAHVQRYRERLIEHYGWSEQDLGKLTLEQQFIKYWHEENVKSLWSEFVPEHSGIRIWQSDAASLDQIDAQAELGASDASLWLARSERFHNFKNDSDAPIAELDRTGRVLIADVRLVVKHRGQGIHTICPYAVRFWYSSERQQWIPRLLSQFATSRDIPKDLLF